MKARSKDEILDDVVSVSDINPKLAQEFYRSPRGVGQHSGFGGGGLDDIISYFVGLARELAVDYPGAGVTVPDNAEQIMRERAKGDMLKQTFIVDKMMKAIQIFEHNTDETRERPAWDSPEHVRESYGYTYLYDFRNLLNGEYA